MTVTIRRAHAEDAAALAELAALDSRRTPSGEVLVAEVGDRLLAAISVDEDHVVADPFRPTRELSALLSERARQVRARGGSAQPSRSSRPTISPAWRMKALGSKIASRSSSGAA